MRLPSFLTALIVYSSMNGYANEVPMFLPVSPKKSKVDFQNTLVETDTLNYFHYDNLYNGAGVAMGDINNDGLPDLYFVSNLGHDQLYLNQGKMKFKNITSKAFTNQDATGWHTAVSMADVNADGWLDIYVCKHGLGQSNKVVYRNLLYINNRDNTFTERAKEFGIDDPGRSIDADFFDYDQDGDLDLFVTNHRENLSVMEIYHQKPYVELYHSNRLYRNDGDKFTDVTKSAGVLSFGYCLASAVSDVNGDGWPDIYVSSDYSEPDFLFINQQNGKFKNEIRERLRHTSHYSMGIDMADYNNDLTADAFVLDMSNRDYRRSKTNMGSMNVATFWDNVAKGYHHQYMYNTLQLNLGSGYFSEIAHMAGIASTDWSWAPLLVDFDQDGFKDLYVTNGYFRDVRDQDFMNRLRTYLATKPSNINTLELLNMIPQTSEVNYFFKNKGDLSFTDVTAEWSLSQGSNSHGAAVGDLDLDGDVDIVINNLNEPATILQNQLNQKNCLKLKLIGPASNPFAYGAKVVVRTNGGNLMQELYPSRGYASSSDLTMIFGLGQADTVYSVEVFWNWKEVSTLFYPTVDETITVKYEESEKGIANTMYLVPSEIKTLHKWKEISYDDYANEVLLPHKMSELGPFVSVGNPVGDELQDIFIGGPRNIPASLFIQTAAGFERLKQPGIEKDSAFEDAGSVFFDADGDGDQDLYVVSGGNEYKAGSAYYQDRLYVNDGKANFRRDSLALPLINSSGQKVLAVDFDQDKDNDLLVFGRQVPGAYLKKPESYLLVNEKGKFYNRTDELAPELKFVGMVTDAVISDLDGDHDDDLWLVGEWMKPTCFMNEGGKFQLKEKINTNQALFGWWNCIVPVDFNNDGILEYALGNTGLNNKFHPTASYPLSAHLEDVDKNGRLDFILTRYFGGELHPVRGRGCLSDQVPEIATRFKTYDEFATSPIQEIFNFETSAEQATEFSNGYLKRKGSEFEFVPFPAWAQIGTINKYLPVDLNQDGYTDLIALGNRYEAEIETPRYDGNPGLVFINEKGSGDFKIFPLQANGPFLNKNAKDAALVGNTLFVVNAGSGLEYLEL